MGFPGLIYRKGMILPHQVRVEPVRARTVVVRLVLFISENSDSFPTLILLYWTFSSLMLGKSMACWKAHFWSLYIFLSLLKSALGVKETTNAYRGNLVRALFLSFPHILRNEDSRNLERRGFSKEKQCVDSGHTLSPKNDKIDGLGSNWALLTSGPSLPVWVMRRWTGKRITLWASTPTLLYKKVTTVFRLCTLFAGVIIEVKRKSLKNYEWAFLPNGIL